MGRKRRTKFTGDFQLRYAAYARDHGMTAEQMLTHDKLCCPFALLKPYLQWINGKRLVWRHLNPAQAAGTTNEEAAFDNWLEQLLPTSDIFICECHKKLELSSHRR